MKASIFLFLLLALPLMGQSQQRCYDYDAAGNRILRTSCGGVTLSVNVLLEGPYVANGSNGSTMTTTLNNVRLLPGQLPSGFFSTPTPVGQPYNTAPWNYNGTEGNGYNHTTAGSNAGYPATVTDWVLISVRETTAKSSEVCRLSALLHNNGQVEFVAGHNTCPLDVTKQHRIVVEHRNHLIVMSHQPISIINGVLTYNFTQQQSYTGLFGSGQKLLNGKYVMLAGNGQQISPVSSLANIDTNDNSLWLSQNGLNSAYLKCDYDLNADVNPNDKSRWLSNSGKFTTVPY